MCVKLRQRQLSQRVCDILFSTLKLKTNFWLLIYSEVFPAYISSEIPGDFLDTWKISSWAIFKLSMSEKGKKKTVHGVGIWICPKGRKKLFCSFFPFPWVPWQYFARAFFCFSERRKSPLCRSQVWTYSALSPPARTREFSKQIYV